MTSYPEQVYRKSNPDGHFFSKGTMRFFKSRIGAHMRTGEVLLFITSEVTPEGRRRWTVRRMNTTTGEIDTVGGFMEYRACSQALAAMRRAAKTEPTP